MKLYRKALRIWITISSLISFLIGWVFLAHIPETGLSTSTSATSSANTLNLPAIPSVKGLANTNSNSGGVQLFSFNPSTSQQSQTTTLPGLRTRGS